MREANVDKNMRKKFLTKAEELKPILHTSKYEVVSYGSVLPDEHSWFNYRFEIGKKPEVLHKGESICLDFGTHCTGTFSCVVNTPIKYPSSPIRLRFKLAETIHELGVSYSDYKGGLSNSWLQEEIVVLDEPGAVTLTRRYAFRYVKVEVEATSVPVQIVDIEVTGVTSADYRTLKEVDLEKRKAQLDNIGIRTLSECMQSVFEDGPKRDRRLWIGDLRLQALVNYETFNNIDLVKRCLYLFAGYTEPGKRTPRCIYVNSKGTFCEDECFVDYSLMFNLILCDYFEHTKEETLVDELFDIADEQILLACRDLDTDGIVQVIPIDERWAFIDWCQGLEKVTSMQGVIIYTLDKMICLCEQTGRSEKAEEYRKIAEKMRAASKERLYDKEKSAFVNSYDTYQYSVHSQVWMILANVLSKEESQALLRKILKDTEVIKPVTPYMHHCVVEALISVDMWNEAMSYVEEYWGAMADLGADTYWEVFVPGQPEVSPYRDRMMNSSCHAWSCSPSYFIRKQIKEGGHTQ